MKKIILFLLALGSTWNCFAQKYSPEKKQRIDQLVHAYQKVNRFNGAVLVASGDQIIYKKGIGLKNAAQKTVNTPQTLFRIYSITKTFTSTVIFKLVEEKKLSLEDPLSKFYPSFPKADSITITHLLTHTSGIYDYTRGNDMKDESEKSFIGFLSTRPLDFSPGKGWSYSNSGYWMLGFIIQRVTGLTYEEAVKQYIFQPAKMDHSGFDFKPLQHKDKATGYELFSSAIQKESTDIDPPGPYAAGAIYSTVEDLYKYFQAHQSYRLISKTSLAKAWTAASGNMGYGYGWQLNELNGKRVAYHGGGGPGFKSNFYTIPQDSVCVILLNNNENPDLDMLTRMICNILYDKPFKIPFEITVDKKRLMRYEGYYDVNSEFSLHISVEDGKLAAQPNGRGKTTLLAEKDNYFYVPEADAYLEFMVNETAQYDKLSLRQGERKIIGKRFEPSWGILGSATDSGWNGTIDIALTKKADAPGIWELKNVSLKTGEFKFRFNNDWNINYGDKNADGKLELHGENIRVETGLYDLELDLTDKDMLRYRLIKL